MVGQLNLAREVDKSEKVSPFEAVRPHGRGVEVLVNGHWSQLRQIGDIPAHELILAAEQKYESLWLKRLSEDIPRVFYENGHVLVSPITVVLVDEGGEHSIELVCTEEKRRSALAYNRSHSATRMPDVNDGTVLRRLLETRFSYWDLVVDNPDWVMEPLMEASNRAPDLWEFELAISMTLARVGDGHTRTRRPVSALLSDLRVSTGLQPCFLPFAVVPLAGDRLVAVEPECGLVDEDHPYLLEIDSLPVEKWVAATRVLVPTVSAQLTAALTSVLLGNVDWLRTRLGLPASEFVTFTLGDGAGGYRTNRLPGKLAPIRQPQRSRDQIQILDENVGYMAIPTSSGSIETILAALDGFRETEGLLIDLRGNRGGTRDLVHRLCPFVLDPDQPSVVYNVAAKRLFPGESPDMHGLLDDRRLFPAYSDHHDSAAQLAIHKLAATFKPEWHPPSESFSDWRYGTIAPGMAPWHYLKPVVVITDEWCFSAAEILTTALRMSPRVLQVGGPTGGGSGRPIQYVLPSSLVQVQISSMASFRPNGNLYEKRGVEPDHIVEPGPYDAAGLSDSVLEAAKAMVLS